MRALIIQHDHVSPPGPVGERLEQRGYDLEVHQVVGADFFEEPNVATAFPDFAAYDAVVTMGAPWPTYDHELVGSWVPAELEQLCAADDAGVPVLGICFGGQLLATAHGGSVGRSDSAEIGFTEVDSDDPTLVASGPWFQWHYDSWTVPPGGREIARNAAASQAFVIRRNLAVQFHPELTSGTLARWLERGGTAKAIAFGLDPRDLLARAQAADQGGRDRAYDLVDAFLERVATEPSVPQGV